jgi:uncharacterized protein
MSATLIESRRNPADANYAVTLPAGEGWLHEIKSGQFFRIVDLEGNQSADTMFYSAANSADRYSAQDTVRAQNSLYLSTGSRLLSNEGHLMLTIVADTCGRHDTLGGACAAESNSVRYAHEKKYMHSCRDTFLHTVTHSHRQINKRDITSNINFFMNVPVTADGKLKFADGVSGPGKYVEMRAEMDVICLISNCPQLNNPCNAYNPTPLQLMIWDGIS